MAWVSLFLSWLTFTRVVRERAFADKVSRDQRRSNFRKVTACIPWWLKKIWRITDCIRCPKLLLWFEKVKTFIDTTKCLFVGRTKPCIRDRDPLFSRKRNDMSRQTITFSYADDIFLTVQSPPLVVSIWTAWDEYTDNFRCCRMFRHI